MKSRIHYLLFLIGMALAGCNTISNLMEGDKLNYKSEAGKRSSLDVPPDLVKPGNDERYTVPDASRGSATLSTYNSAKPETVRSTVVLPEVKEASIERAGSQRWLVVNRPPEELWPIVREFWQQNGFLINLESPETGILETDWAENRAKLGKDLIRSILGKVLDGLYSTGERDKFRTRLEKTDKGTEIFISHRGMIEVYTSGNKEQTVWQPRPSDPELEAELLRRLMLTLGVESERAQTQIAAAAQPERAHLQRDGSAVVGLRVNESFDRAWRRIGLALDRVGFTVEDRDRTQGVYFVRYVDPEIDNKTTEKSPGFFRKLLNFKKAPEKPVQFRITVAGAGAAEQSYSQVSIQNKEGQPERTETSARILALLHEQLK